MIAPTEQGKWELKNAHIVLVATYEEGDSFAIFTGTEGNMELTTCSCSGDGSIASASVIREGVLPSGRKVVWHEDNRFSLLEKNGTPLYSTGVAFKPRHRTACDDDHCSDDHECSTGQAHQFGGAGVICLDKQVA